MTATIHDIRTGKPKHRRTPEPPPVSVFPGSDPAEIAALAAVFSPYLSPGVDAEPGQVRARVRSDGSHPDGRHLDGFTAMSDPAELYASLVDDETPWQHYARCAEVDPELFFPSRGEVCESAKRICRACEVKGPCLEYALEHDGLLGIWGGMSEGERRLLKRERRAA